MKKSTEYTELIPKVREFRDEFQQLLDLGVSFHKYSTIPNEAWQIRERVGLLAAGAAHGIVMAGAMVMHQDAPIAGGRRTTINPATSWSQAIDGDGFIEPRHVLDSCNLAIGQLDEMRLQAERTERSLAGRVARFIRFPAEVREAAGFRPGTAAGRTTLGIAAAIQTVLTGTIIGVMTAALLELFGAT